MLSRYLHTLRYLRPVQFYGRAWFKLSKPRIDFAEAPALRTMSGNWVPPARRRPSLLEPLSFRFLNSEHELTDASFWDNPALEKLWRYNLHYFDDLNAEDAESRIDWHRELMPRWVLENPPAKGTGWEPYPVSMRVVNWIKWALSGNNLAPDCLHSLAVQARWLSRRMEIHLLGNHLLTNAKALVFAGLFFSGPESELWLEKGLRFLAREVPEQILADGGQFERSTMYHALALEDMLDICNVTQAFQDAVPSYRASVQVAIQLDVVSRMRNWLAAMCHPDGGISFFNDSATGISPPLEELEAYAERLGFPTLPDERDGATHLADSGYIRIQQGGMVALLDVAPVGPDYLPGHAHADTLSFELSLSGQRVIVNSGTSCYGNDAERLRQRGTAAHNTVVVDEQNSSEVWSGFRVARRARPIGLSLTCNGGIEVRCAHDGYRRLPGKPEHMRRWLFGTTALVVEDRISGGFGRAEARFHLHPQVVISGRSVDSRGCAKVVLQLPKGEKVQVTVDGGLLREEISTWHPEFGLSLRSLCLVADIKGSVLRTHLEWSDAA
ncbi:MAG: alginate lyase family protein [Nitrospirae bacterium]|nr:alginate lyase family protein [Nitrospirota bacterium]